MIVYRDKKGRFAKRGKGRKPETIRVYRDKKSRFVPPPPKRITQQMQLEAFEELFPELDEFDDLEELLETTQEWYHS